MHRFTCLGHSGFGLEVGPGIVSQFSGDLVPQLNDLSEQIAIGCACQSIALPLESAPRAELAEYRFTRANTALGRYEYESALSGFQRAVQLSPLNPTYRRAFADLHLLRGNLATHLEQLRVIASDSDCTDCDESLQKYIVTKNKTPTKIVYLFAFLDNPQPRYGEQNAEVSRIGDRSSAGMLELVELSGKRASNCQ